MSDKFEEYLDDVEGNGYFDGAQEDEGHMRIDMIVEQARFAAEVLKDSGVTTGQIRKFFTMARSIERSLEAGQKWEIAAARIAEMKPHAAALVGRAEQNKKDSLKLFQLFIAVNAGRAYRSEKAFKGFLRHFQSVIAYFSLYQTR